MPDISEHPDKDILMKTKSSNAIMPEHPYGLWILILGIAGVFVPLIPIVAIILAFLAKKDIKEDGDTSFSTRMTMGMWFAVSSIVFHVLIFVLALILGSSVGDSIAKDGEAQQEANRAVTTVTIIADPSKQAANGQGGIDFKGPQSQDPHSAGAGVSQGSTGTYNGTSSQPGAYQQQGNYSGSQGAQGANTGVGPQYGRGGTGAPANTQGNLGSVKGRGGVANGDISNQRIQMVNGIPVPVISPEDALGVNINNDGPAAPVAPASANGAVNQAQPAPQQQGSLAPVQAAPAPAPAPAPQPQPVQYAPAPAPAPVQAGAQPGLG